MIQNNNKNNRNLKNQDKVVQKLQKRLSEEIRKKKALTKQLEEFSMHIMPKEKAD
ncbi:hypothetical protein [Vagococcus silagei]|uniref:hypothetical protein n=1 Tax=Vagococcus silagei TaxID=2508885 RepID=UPI0013A5FA7B|nr:hypothetical protein [Vagococcus silagei]